MLRVESLSNDKAMHAIQRLFSRLSLYIKKTAFHVDYYSVYRILVFKGWL